VARAGASSCRKRVAQALVCAQQREFRFALLNAQRDERAVLARHADLVAG